MNKIKLINEIRGLVDDVNANEIAHHIHQAHLYDWCGAWRTRVSSMLDELERNCEIYEPKYGTWTIAKDSWGWKCSECKYPIINPKLTKRFKFCPNCGAKMDSEI